MFHFCEKYSGWITVIMLFITLIIGYQFIPGQGIKCVGIGLIVIGIVAFYYTAGDPISQLRSVGYVLAGTGLFYHHKESGLANSALEAKTSVTGHASWTTWGRENVLMLLAIGCSIVIIIYLWRMVTEMLVLIWVIQALIFGLIGFFASKLIGTFVAISLTVIATIAVQATAERNQSVRDRKGVAVLTIINFSLFPMRYINGRDTRSKKYETAEWKSKTVAEKKECIRKEVAEFASLLPPDEYIIETHDSMYNLIKKNIPAECEIVSEKKLCRIFSWKIKGDFKAIYGKKDWKRVMRKRKVNVWRFKLEKKIEA